MDSAFWDQMASLENRMEAMFRSFGLWTPGRSRMGMLPARPFAPAMDVVAKNGDIVIRLDPAKDLTVTADSGELTIPRRAEGDLRGQGGAVLPLRDLQAHVRAPRPAAGGHATRQGHRAVRQWRARDRSPRRTEAGARGEAEEDPGQDRGSSQGLIHVPSPFVGGPGELPGPPDRECAATSRGTWTAITSTGGRSRWMAAAAAWSSSSPRTAARTRLKPSDGTTALAGTISAGSPRSARRAWTLRPNRPSRRPRPRDPITTSSASDARATWASRPATVPAAISSTSPLPMSPRACSSSTAFSTMTSASARASGKSISMTCTASPDQAALPRVTRSAIAGAFDPSLKLLELATWGNGRTCSTGLGRGFHELPTWP